MLLVAENIPTCTCCPTYLPLSIPILYIERDAEGQVMSPRVIADATAVYNGKVVSQPSH